MHMEVFITLKITGIIVEYNPLHPGHIYHMEQARKQTGADYLIAVMSGSFVQRGAPALLDKYTRTRMALLAGADVVIELPVCFAAGSAGDFAAGAVSLLDKLGCVDSLCFGSESGDISLFEKTASLLQCESAAFSDALKKALKAGLSFPAARQQALLLCLDPKKTTDEGANFPRQDTRNVNELSTAPMQSTITPATTSPMTSEARTSVSQAAQISALLSSPNNLLGLEYTSALLQRNSSIRPFTISRVGSGYHDPLGGAADFPSASALRSLLAKQGKQALLAQLQCYPELQPLLPLWEEVLSQNAFLFSNDLSSPLHYRLLTAAPGSFGTYAEVGKELADKLEANRLSFTDWDDLCARLKTREITYSKISRCLCRILLSVPQEMLLAARDNDYTPYARILGFRKSASPLLSVLKKNSSIPLLSRPAAAARSLSPEALALYEKDVLAAHLTQTALCTKTGQLPIHEYTRQLILL